MLPTKSYLVGVIKWAKWTRQRWFVRTSKDLQTCFWEVLFLSTTCSYPLGGVVIKCSSMVVFVKDSVSWTHLSIWSAQSVFSLGYYWLLNKRLIIFEFSLNSPKVGVVGLTFRPIEVIRVGVSMYKHDRNYGRVIWTCLSPPRF